MTPTLANTGESVLRRALVSTLVSVPRDSRATTVKSTLTTAGTLLVAIKALVLTRWTILSAPVSHLSLERLARLSLTHAQLDLASTEVPAHLMATSTSSPVPVHLATRVHAVSWTSTNVLERIRAGMMESV